MFLEEQAQELPHLVFKPLVGYSNCVNVGELRPRELNSVGFLRLRCDNAALINAEKRMLRFGHLTRLHGSCQRDCL